VYAVPYNKVAETIAAERTSIPGGHYQYSVCHNVGILGICTTIQGKRFYFLSLTVGGGRWFKPFFPQGGINLFRGKPMGMKP
jgi:hypothetical protein